MNWEDLVEGYLGHRHQVGDAPGTAELTAFWLRSFVGYCRLEGVSHPHQLGPFQVEAYHRHLMWTSNSRGRLYSPHTVSRAMQLTRSFLRWAHQEGELPLDPGQNLLLHEPPRRKKPVLTREEVEVLLDTPDPTDPMGLRDRALLHLYYFAQLFPYVCHRLDLEHLDPRASTLCLGELSRELGDRELGALDRYLHKARAKLNPRDQALFVNCWGWRMGQRHLARLVGKYARRTGLRAGFRELQRSFREHLGQGRRFAPGGEQ